jgi:two-component system LytT family response regulator
MNIKILIVDDEALARERLRGLLAAEPDVEIVAECQNGYEAIAAVENLQPDLMFLDVQMPELDGFQMLARLKDTPLPLIIFVTAYEQYALQAFEYHALDYLLKPFDAERFQQAFQHARRTIERQTQHEVTARLAALLEELPKSQQYLSRLVVRTENGMRLLPIDDMDWLEAQGNYVQIHSAGQTYSLRETMKFLEKSLNPEQFLRIHRAYIVNIQRIQELQPWASGEYTLILRDGTRLFSSRSYHDAIERLLHNRMG